ncbi:MULTISPECIES: hypothetical protein [unclassified Sphingomonas]|uniref:hypothetical protein n=1 Tax=unclassified Sphingomonas TaxID=196159 RepID=UPI0007015222|nr:MULTISPECIES: hypothetical protein [unclassified Sphingomonas]KQX18367.1 hypothetical protein ASD17_14495 [Sphingomonas sp. Root1294]KQY72308.1 hypothetical protein ASD39_20480 [Sphingomonas sp. Root50]KRB94421.1 hypothetical protein ASE22_00270 [Sphingomonas sp. Root720]
MPRTKRPKPLYQRGDFKLYARPGRNHEIVWYDATAGRERSASAGTVDLGQAKLELDRLYLKDNGQRFCETCGRPFDGDTSPMLVAAIGDYLLLSEAKVGYRATRNRLAHAVDYAIATNPTVTCAQIDQRWIDGFRKWLADKPVVQGSTTRPRSLGSIEGCVLQLAAAINATPGQDAQFSNEQPKNVAASPTYRADVATIAAMFRFCLDPVGKHIRSPKEREVYIGYRANLLAYLRAAVATWARPEEIFDLGKGQWVSAAGVLDLNPPGRRQTRKYRGRIPVAKQFAPFLDAMGDRYMAVDSIRATWEAMRAELGLPGDREAGPKLIRRSISTIVRRRIGEERWRQGEMMLGHVKSSISDIYAIPDPANLGLALAATESIIDEIEKLTPGAFYRTFTAQAPALLIVEGGKNG